MEHLNLRKSHWRRQDIAVLITKFRVIAHFTRKLLFKKTKIVLRFVIFVTMLFIYHAVHLPCCSSTMIFNTLLWKILLQVCCYYWYMGLTHRTIFFIPAALEPASVTKPGYILFFILQNIRRIDLLYFNDSEERCHRFWL